ncbi:MAG: hypothetical protein WD872_11055 [Pirellulaceae bacterium]
MSDNPYKSPGETQSNDETAGDPLRGLAIASFIVSSLAIVASVVQVVASIVLLKMLADLDRPELEREVTSGLLTAGLWFVFGVSGIIVARGMRQRRRRWLVIAWSIAAIASCLLSPLGALVLMRLWRKDVWNSFANFSGTIESSFRI